MKLLEIMEECKSKCWSEKRFIDLLKTPNLELPSSINEWNIFYNNLKDYLIIEHLMETDCSPYKNIDNILELIIHRRELDNEEKKLLLKNAIYFSCGKNSIFNTMDSLDKIVVFNKYLIYRFENFVNRYSFKKDSIFEELKKNIAQEIFSVNKNGILSLEEIKSGVFMFQEKFKPKKSKTWDVFYNTINEGVKAILIKEERETIYGVLENKNISIANKKRL